MVETITFIIFAVAAVGGALVMVWAANPVHSAMGLILTMISIAVFYVLNSGHFIAAVQVIVYAGAVMTLFLFVIMLIGVDRAEDRSERLPAQRQIALGLSALLGTGILIAGRDAWVTGRFHGPAPNGTVQDISDELFSRWLLSFEITALLLIVAATGTIALAFFRTEAEE